MKKVEGLIKHISSNLLKGDGYYIASLILDWPKIVGDQLSTIAKPEKIVFPKRRYSDEMSPGILHLKVVHSAYAFELSYQQELLIERVNSFFGKKLVEKLVFKHGNAMKVETIFPQKERPSVTVSSDILRAVNHVEDSSLQQALLSLAKHLK